jgi:hypothetical protein
MGCWGNWGFRVNSINPVIGKICYPLICFANGLDLEDKLTPIWLYFANKDGFYAPVKK